jgi:hypothetical protein
LNPYLQPGLEVFRWNEEPTIAPIAPSPVLAPRHAIDFPLWNTERLGDFAGSKEFVIDHHGATRGLKEHRPRLDGSYNY